MTGQYPARMQDIRIKRYIKWLRKKIRIRLTFTMMIIMA